MTNEFTYTKVIILQDADLIREPKKGENAKYLVKSEIGEKIEYADLVLYKGAVIKDRDLVYSSMERHLEESPQTNTTPPQTKTQKYQHKIVNTHHDHLIDTMTLVKEVILDHEQEGWEFVAFAPKLHLVEFLNLIFKRPDSGEEA